MKTANFICKNEALGSYTQYEGQSLAGFEDEVERTRAELTRELYREGVNNPQVMAIIIES